MFISCAVQELNISRNRINVLVPEVGNLFHLRVLDAQQTNLATLPAEIAFCQELETLQLWGNAMESLPDTLNQMPRLRTLAINYRSFAAVIDSYMENLLRKVSFGFSEHFSDHVGLSFIVSTVYIPRQPRTLTILGL